MRRHHEPARFGVILDDGVVPIDVVERAASQARPILGLGDPLVDPVACFLAKSRSEPVESAL
jgi:hypothetical protein